MTIYSELTSIWSKLKGNLDANFKSTDLYWAEVQMLCKPAGAHERKSFQLLESLGEREEKAARGKTEQRDADENGHKDDAECYTAAIGSETRVVGADP